MNNHQEFTDVRVFFSKTGIAKYISHLDLYRTVQRALKRAKLPVWETQGFNRHIYLTFALPLSLGTQGCRESMDMRLVSPLPFDEMSLRLNNALCNSIRILETATPIMKHTMIKKAEYKIADINIETFGEFLNSEKIEVEKKTKKKKTLIDLKPFIEGVKLNDTDITLTLPAGNDFNINPVLLIEGYKNFMSEKERALVAEGSLTRTRVLTADGEEFR
ncbi:MAG: TIGR03936 family radical SAM-associated protein [Oscillospiraceae bacterium]|nr:TIGR03936 family radical SAM-associated protein [Oscillospiraceae bacterium]